MAWSSEKRNLVGNVNLGGVRKFRWEIKTGVVKITRERMLNEEPSI